METLATTFLEQLTATPEGRRHLLSISVDAEEGDEQGIFDQLADHVDDEDLRRIVLRHRDDEVRHAGLFRDCLARAGLEKQPVPDDMRIIRQIAVASPGGAGRGVATRRDVAERYALLLAIEERGVEQFPTIAAAFRPHDAETSDVYLRVARDERGHVAYCERIGRRFAESHADWEELVDRARRLEADAFVHVGLANVAYCTEQGWVDLG